MGHRLLKAARPTAATVDEPAFLAQWRQAQRHLRAHYVHGGRAPALDTVIELGRGRPPVVAVGLALSGARRVLCFDEAPLLPPEQVIATARMYKRWLERGHMPALEPDAAARLDDVLGRGAERPAAWLLAALGIEQRQADGRRTGLWPSSVDLFLSCGALDDAPAALFAEFRRVAHCGAVMSHRVRSPADAIRRQREAGWVVLEEEPTTDGTWLTAALAPVH